MNYNMHSKSKLMQDYCIDFALKNNVKIFNKSIDSNKIFKVNFESNARKYRYQELKDICLRNNINCILTAHHENDQIETITSIKNHLTENGRLIFNIFVPNLESMVSADDVLYHHKDVDDFDNDRKFIIWNQSKYDQFNQIEHTRIVVDELNNKEQVVNRFYRDFSLRYVFRWELYHLLISNGFKLLNLYGDFEKSDFDDSSTEMIWEFGLE